MYHYTDCGLPNIFLSNGFTFHDSPQYGRAVSITEIRELNRAIAADLISKPGRLDKNEIRFLRHEMDLSQRALATLLGAAEITVRKWEAGDSTISYSNDRLLRACYADFAQACGVFELIKKLSELDKSSSNKPRRLVFESNDGWHRRVAS